MFRALSKLFAMIHFDHLRLSREQHLVCYHRSVLWWSTMVVTLQSFHATMVETLQSFNFMHLSHKDIEKSQLNVQNELDKVDTWMRSNRLWINYNKTAYMILTATCSQKCNFEISMNGVRIQQTDSIKYLGVIIDNKLGWKLQISNLCGNLSQACGVVCKIRHFADTKILRLIYFSLFHSRLQYCIIDWVRAYKTVIRPM